MPFDPLVPVLQWSLVSTKCPRQSDPGPSRPGRSGSVKADYSRNEANPRRKPWDSDLRLVSIERRSQDLQRPTPLGLPGFHFPGTLCLNGNLIKLRSRQDGVQYGAGEMLRCLFARAVLLWTQPHSLSRYRYVDRIGW